MKSCLLIFITIFGLAYRFLLAPVVIPLCAVFGLQLLLHQNFGVSLPGWGMWVAFFVIAYMTGFLPFQIMKTMESAWMGVKI